MAKFGQKWFDLGRFD